MIINNDASRQKKELIIKLIKLFDKEELIEKIDQIPIDMFPKESSNNGQSIYQERAILKYRIMSILGFNIEDETDELEMLKSYAKKAIERSKSPSYELSVITEACSSCVKHNYFITNACRGCTAQPCINICPANAIEKKGNYSIINKELCKNCGKCTDVCPYHAIIYVPVPCEENCPVNAIEKNEFGKEKINISKCIDCGQCLSNCPFGAIIEKSHLIDVLSKIKNGKKVNLMIAPAITGHFPEKLNKIAGALKECGFNKITEVAYGAEITAEKESTELRENLANGKNFMTSSCCPAYVNAVSKHYPGLAEFVSHTLSPMVYTAKYLKNMDKESINVFAGPCNAKKSEAIKYDEVDYVLTFEELGALLIAKNIEIDSCEDYEFEEKCGYTGRCFPISGNIASLVNDGDTSIKTQIIDGLDKKSGNLLKVAAKGLLKTNFLEVMCCKGGCAGGPCGNTVSNIASIKIKKEL